VGHPTVTPKSLLLDLLRVTPHPVAVRQLVAVGALFGLEGNAVRVALTRLVGRGLLASDERGSYRLAAEADPIARWADGWRQGERRLRAWGGAWLCLWHPRGGERGVRGRSHRALGRIGFREGRDGMWVRPDNLRARAPAVEEQLRELGLMAGSVLFVGQEMPGDVVAGWVESLWPIEQTAAGQRRALRDIERSRARLARLAGGEALVESFLCGGAAIRALARDPLLPDEIAPGGDRRALGDAMRDYDRRGRAIWKDMLQLTTPALDGAPIHMGAFHGPP
jgi:phenylacetic acid degradation operon negative regulatory protein